MYNFLNNIISHINFSLIKMKREIVSIDDLKDILGDNPAIADVSSLSKLQDTFPLEIFNFQVMLKVFQNGNFNLMLYLFPLC